MGMFRHGRPSVWVLGICALTLVYAAVLIHGASPSPEVPFIPFVPFLPYHSCSPCRGLLPGQSIVGLPPSRLWTYLPSIL